MINAKKDFTGMVIGDFTVLDRHNEDYTYPNGRKMPQWNVMHTCGRTLIFKTQYLTSGKLMCECMKPHCVYDLTGEYGVGYTSKGEEFWFDLEDYDKIKDFYWWYDNVGYVQTITNNKHLRLHRLVMNVTDPLIKVDHIIHPYGTAYKIDNRKSNLRIVTESQNGMNKFMQSNNVSGIVGVRWNEVQKRWTAEIGLNNKNIRLGSFTDKDEAIKVRKRAEEIYFEEFAFNKNNHMEEINNEY